MKKKLSELEDTTEETHQEGKATGVSSSPTQYSKRKRTGPKRGAEAQEVSISNKRLKSETPAYLFVEDSPADASAKSTIPDYSSVISPSKTTELQLNRKFGCDDQMQNVPSQDTDCHSPARGDAMLNQNPMRRRKSRTTKYGQIKQTDKPGKLMLSQKARKSFDDRFNDLMVFKQQFGHCCLPNLKPDNEYYSLSRWCRKIRGDYRVQREGRAGYEGVKLSKEQVQRLENAGFDLVDTKERSFDRRLDELVVFKKEYGHCYPPKTYNASLSSWCQKVRYAYKAEQNGIQGDIRLSLSDIEALKEIGFDFKAKRHKSWEDNFQELAKFAENVGHCRAPRQTKLGSWCNKLKSSYDMMRRGKEITMDLSDERIQRLKRIGFDFSFKAVPSFDERFAELMQFKKKFGHCNVPFGRKLENGRYYSLGNWSYNIRSSVIAMKEGKDVKCRLSESDIRRLEEVGFDFVIQNRKMNPT